MDSELDDLITKDQPIICIMCKSARKGDERLLMFGGNRPFMAKFEAKFIAFIGRDKLLDLQKKCKTRRDRSYICKHCCSIVNKTFDNIKKIQHGVARSVRKALSQDVAADEESYSDQELGSNSQANIPKKKLPPLTERLAEKVASLTLVKINCKVPKIVLEPVVVRDDPRNSKKDRNGEGSCVGVSESNNVRKDYLGGTQAENKNALQITPQKINQQEYLIHRPEKDVKNTTTLKSQAENTCTSKVLFQSSLVPLNVDTSHSVQQSVNEDTACDLTSEC